MPADWSISYWPVCATDAFLSHCAEDRETLIKPVYDELLRRKVIPWADWHNYPISRPALEVLREELLRCRHVVYFITPAALRQGRGWMAAERGYTENIQRQFTYGSSEIAHVELPLLFLPRNESLFQRSAWRALVDHAHECPTPARAAFPANWFKGLDHGERIWTDAHVQWAAGIIEKFVIQEETWARELGARMQQDSRLRGFVSREANMTTRVLAQSPEPLTDR